MPFAVSPPGSWRHRLRSPAVALEVDTAATGKGVRGVGDTALQVTWTLSGVRGGHVWAKRGTGG